MDTLIRPIGFLTVIIVVMWMIIIAGRQDAAMNERNQTQYIELCTKAFPEKSADRCLFEYKYPRAR